jgi:uncharacterized damage-inducible protein DinB
MEMSSFLKFAMVGALLGGPAVLHAQEDGLPDAALGVSVTDGASYVRAMVTAAAEAMSEDDYTFRPTPDVRSFAEILIHVALSNYNFCSTAIGQTSPARELRPNGANREQIRRLLEDSFSYCDQAMGTAMAEPEKPVEFGGSQRSSMAVMNFRNYHSLLHYGNIITYMRLRGRTPPSSEAPAAGGPREESASFQS